MEKTKSHPDGGWRWRYLVADTCKGKEVRCLEDAGVVKVVKGMVRVLLLLFSSAVYLFFLGFFSPGCRFRRRREKPQQLESAERTQDEESTPTQQEII
jgi:hypothetical protein